jgi:hypothetical protein
MRQRRVNADAVAAIGAVILARLSGTGAPQRREVAAPRFERPCFVEHVDPFQTASRPFGSVAPPTASIPILSAVETPDFFDVDPNEPPSRPRGYTRPSDTGLSALGERVTWVSGLVLALSSFMDWYAGSGVGIKLAVIGWHTGVLGKLVFFVGLAVVAIIGLRELGFELPPTVPDSLLVLALGALGAIFVLIRVISIPDSVLPADARGIGIWISLVASLGVIAGGLLRAAEEL